jgi:predicted nucleotidyltransferase component of viral defense system
MITKQDILDRAGEWQLRPEVVEKDYVLGWLLWGLGHHPTVDGMWVFKGGTCLKKCYFETYRFSEDLDFTLRPEAPYTKEDILAVLRGVGEVVAAESGIEIAIDAIVAQEKKDKQGRLTFKARLGYKGPLAFPGEPRRILFDLTAHEPILRPPTDAPIFHPYPDLLPSPASIRAYPLEELLAEKTRALFERTRPRDLYDVVFVINNQRAELDLARTRDLFLGKCQAKALEPPNCASLVARIRSTEELRSAWENMLRHQLPQLPPIDSMLEGVPAALQWIDAVAPIPAAVLSGVPTGVIEETVAPAGIQYWGQGVGLETIRFAGTNRLLVRFIYHGRERLVEPYALRRAGTGNLLLYAWPVGETHIKAFNTAEIRSVQATERAFIPRYRIEFVTGGFAPILPSPAPARHAVVRSRRPRTGHATRTHRSGPIYIFTCAVCGKEFRHGSRDSTLRKHKAPGGHQCSGRHGHLSRVI